MNKFWNFKESENERILTIDGVIAEESWFDDDVTPKIFQEELNKGNGDLTLWLNSPGGDCIAASRIYTMLMNYKGEVNVKIDGIAASAASVIAMAGTKVSMAPTALMMIHNPLTVAIGDEREMKKAESMLKEVKESIINAYEIKTGLSRDKISRLMDVETWFDVNSAMEMGFCDGILERKRNIQTQNSFLFSRMAVTNSLLDKMNIKKTNKVKTSELLVRVEELKSNF